MEYVILVTFEEPRQVANAISELRRLDDDGAIAVQASAIVARGEDGSFRMDEDADHVGVRGSVAAGLLGALLGALAGPVGVLVGGMTGVAIGSVADAVDADAVDALVSTVARRVSPGTTAVVAAVEEPSVEVLDAVVASLGGTAVRWPRAHVEAELAATADAVADADRTSSLATGSMHDDDVAKRRVGQRSEPQPED